MFRFDHQASAVQVLQVTPMSRLFKCVPEVFLYLRNLLQVIRNLETLHVYKASELTMIEMIQVLTLDYAR